MLAGCVSPAGGSGLSASAPWPSASDEEEVPFIKQEDDPMLAAVLLESLGLVVRVCESCARVCAGCVCEGCV